VASENENLTQSIRPKSEIFGTGLGCQYCTVLESRVESPGGCTCNHCLLVGLKNADVREVEPTLNLCGCLCPGWWRVCGILRHVLSNCSRRRLRGTHRHGTPRGRGAPTRVPAFHYDRLHRLPCYPLRVGRLARQHDIGRVLDWCGCFLVLVNTVLSAAAR
jgi:hypothetical protein